MELRWLFAHAVIVAFEITLWTLVLSLLRLRLRRRPGLELALWSVLLVKLLAPPLHPIVPPWYGFAGAAPTTTWLPSELRVYFGPVPRFPGKSVTPMFVQPPIAIHLYNRWNLPAVLGGIWLAGLCVSMAASAWAMIRFRRMVAGAQEAPASLQTLAWKLARDMELASEPRVLVSNGDVAPSCHGVRRPTVLLPGYLVRRADEGALRTVLAHELAHFARRDWLIHLCATLAGWIWWFHPILPLLRRRLKLLTEVGCDRRAMQTLRISGSMYTSQLFHLLDLLLQRPTHKARVRTPMLEDRVIRAIEYPPEPTTGTARVVAWGAVLLMAVVTLPGTSSVLRAGLLPTSIESLMLAGAMELREASHWAVSEGGNGHDYELYMPRVTAANLSWMEAARLAAGLERNGRRGHLVIVDSAEEHEFLRRHFCHHLRGDAVNFEGDSFWIGLTDHEQEGRYVWVNGEECRWTAWGRGEPNNIEGVEDFVHYHLRKGGFSWNDSAESQPLTSFSALFGFLVEYE